MDEIDNCPKCNSSNLLINVWGYPVEEEIKKLEASGYQVEIHGCVPPYAGQEAFIYHCKDCGEKFVDYVDEIEEEYEDDDEDEDW